MSTATPVVAPRIDRFLRLMTSRGASDFHLTVGRPPMLRVSGAMETIRYRALTETDYVELVRPSADLGELLGLRIGVGERLVDRLRELFEANGHRRSPV